MRGWAAFYERLTQNLRCELGTGEGPGALSGERWCLFGSATSRECEAEVLGALRLWWGMRPRWPGVPTVTVEANAEVTREMDAAMASMNKLADAILKQGGKK